MVLECSGVKHIVIGEGLVLAQDYLGDVWRAEGTHPTHVNLLPSILRPNPNNENNSTFFQYK